MRKGYFIVAIATLSLALFLFLRQKKGELSESSSQQATARLASKSNNSPRSAQADTKSGFLSNGQFQAQPSSGIKPSENFPEGGTHEPAQLKNFALPSLQAKNVTLREAIALILQSYIDVCTVTRQEPISFIVNFEGDTDQRVDLNLEGSLTTMLFQAGLRFQSRLTHNEAILSFQSFADSSNEPLTNAVTRSFRVPPEFEKRLARVLGFEAPSADNPLENEGSALLDLSIAELLPKMGLANQEGAIARYIPSSTTLVIRDSPSNLESFTSFLEPVLRQSPLQYKTSTKIISSPTPVDLSSLRQSSDAMEPLMRGVSQNADTYISTLPSVVHREEETATVEITQEHSPSDWNGLRLQVSNNRYGFGQQQSINFESRPNDEGQINGIPTPTNQFEVDELGPNSSSLVHSTQTAEGNYLYTIATTHLIDATGRAFDPLSNNNATE